MPIVQSDHYLNCELEDSLLQKLLSRTEMKTFLGELQLKVMLINVAPKFLGCYDDMAFLVEALFNHQGM